MGGNPTSVGAEKTHQARRDRQLYEVDLDVRPGLPGGVTSIPGAIDRWCSLSPFGALRLAPSGVTRIAEPHQLWARVAPSGPMRQASGLLNDGANATFAGSCRSIFIISTLRDHTARSDNSP